MLKKISLVIVACQVFAIPVFSQYFENDYDYSADRPTPTITAKLIDLRVYVDAFDENGIGPKSRPIYTNPITNGQPISQASLEKQVAQGLSYWASLMPDFHFRIVSSVSQANFVFRWRKYQAHIGGSSTAESFRPESWNISPDLTCGAGTLNDPAHGIVSSTPNYYINTLHNNLDPTSPAAHNSAGEECDETSNNIILFQTDESWLNPDEVVTLTSRMRFDYFNSLASTTRKAFVDKSIASPVPGDCKDGDTDPSNTRWFMGDGVCIPYADLGPNSANPAPYSDRIRFGFDIAATVQHEFGHTLIGDHSFMNGGQQYFQDNERKPVFLEDQMVRKRPTLTLPSVWSYSTMFAGWGDNSTNTRGVFELDADRAAVMLYSGGTPNVYRVTYPKTKGVIRMVDANSGVYLTSDWITALSKGGWRTSSEMPMNPSLFIKDVYPDAVGQQKVGMGDNHTIAVKVDGTLWGWGKNDLGQASGNGTPTSSPILTPVQIKVSGLSDNGWVAASAGSDFSVALRSDGTLYAWGANGTGSLGDGTTSNRSKPTRVCNDAGHACNARRFVSISAGSLHIAALADNGTIWSWGYNGEGEAGNNTTGNQAWPVQEATGASDWISVAAGSNHTVALKRDGTIRSWGYNGNGQLGTGNTSNSLVPARDATALNNVLAVSVGRFSTFALLNDHTLRAWGQNFKGETGNGTANSGLLSPTAVFPNTRWLAAGGGAEFTGGLQQDGTIWSWGDNQDGQFGNNSTTNSLTEKQEHAFSTKWASIYPHFYQTSALRTDGTLWGWGYNEFGQLGNGSTTVRVLTPVKANWTYGAIYGGNPAATPATVNLTSEGTLDWAQWGQPTSGTFNQRNIVAAPLSEEEYSAIIPETGDIANAIAAAKIGSVNPGGHPGAITYIWTNGKPNASQSGNNALYMTGVGNGWKLTLPAGTATRTLKLYVGVYKAQGKLVAHMGDGSAVDFVNTGLNNSTGTSNGVYTLTYAAASNARTLTVSWTLNSTPGGGNVTLQAATYN